MGARGDDLQEMNDYEQDCLNIVTIIAAITICWIYVLTYRLDSAKMAADRQIYERKWTMNDLISEIRKLNDDNPVAKAVFRALKDYSRNMTATTVSTLAWRSNQTEHDVKEACREFERLKLGRYVKGAWNSPCRFEWAVKITELGAVAAREQDSLDEEFSFEEEIPSEPNSSTTMDSIGDSDRTNGRGIGPESGIVHRFKLRPDFEVSFTLPVDFSKTEASRVAQFVASLPFEP